MIDLNNIRTIIFDLGGVVLDIYPERTVQAFDNLGIRDAASWVGNGHHKALFHDLEVGKISEKVFYDEVRSLVKDKLSTEAIKLAWNAMIGTISLERIGIIERLRATRSVFLLSNTNVIHHKHFDAMAAKYDSLSDLFDKVYYSYEMGLSKPDSAIFQQVLSENQLKPEETLFLDDSTKNIEVAQAMGMQAVLITPNEGMEQLFK
ncbi:HAD family phosphatase [Marinilabiliaceae bacterium JC017]|nr:HAD family phosphatase [Marinilabiliaceae bacterium JC017]